MKQPHTPIPPTAQPQTIQDKINWLRLCRSRRVGPATFVRLLNEHGSSDAALDALPNIAQRAGLKSYEAYDAKAAEHELDQGLNAGFTPLFLGQAPYPTLLSQCSDAPAFLWARGNVDWAARPCVGMVGARNASSLGLRIAANIARELGELGYCVVSGLARGIDASAHTAALELGTIAVQAGGLNITYPKENTKLQSQIGENGLCVSEQPIGLIPQARHFPQRNRIIAGLSMAVVVVEGASRSGSLITARAAADLGRDVMAVPGNPMDGRASGCNMLIRDGATLIRSASDIHESLNLMTNAEQTKLDLPSPIPKQVAKPKDASKKIMRVLSTSPVSEDVVIRDTGLSSSDVSRQLTALELSGKVERHAGGLLSRAS